VSKKDMGQKTGSPAGSEEVIANSTFRSFENGGKKQYKNEEARQGKGSGGSKKGFNQKKKLAVEVSAGGLGVNSWRKMWEKVGPKPRAHAVRERNNEKKGEDAKKETPKRPAIRNYKCQEGSLKSF